MWCRFSRVVREALHRGGGGVAPAPPPPPSPAPSAAAGGVSSVTPICEGRSSSRRGAEREDAYRKWFDAVPHSWVDVFSWTGALLLGLYGCPGSGRLPRESPLRKNVRGFETIPTPRREIGSFRSVDFSLVNVGNEKGTNGKRPPVGEADDEFKNILKDLENKAGIDAIDNGEPREGVAMLQLAAQRNYPPALFNLAICYERGLGVERDENMAMELYRSAAIRNHPGAMYNLAIFYGQGRGGLPRDSDIAEELLRVAAARGRSEAVSALKMFEEEKINENKPTFAKRSPTESFLNMIGCDSNINSNMAGTILSY